MNIRGTNAVLGTSATSALADPEMALETEAAGVGHAVTENPESTFLVVARFGEQAEAIACPEFIRDRCAEVGLVTDDTDCYQFTVVTLRLLSSSCPSSSLHASSTSTYAYRQESSMPTIIRLVLLVDRIAW